MSDPCPTCKSTGFAKSRLGSDHCEFCDGTFGGNPPTNEDIEEELWKDMLLYGTSYRRIFPDGSIERIAPQDYLKLGEAK